MSVVGLIAGLGLIAFGGLDAHQANTYGERQDITMDELASGEPVEGWYRITGATWNELQSLYQEDEQNGQIQSNGMLVFVLPETIEPMEQARLMMPQEGAELADAIEQARALDMRIQQGEMYVAQQEAAGAPVDETQIADAIAALDELEALEAGYARAETIEGLISSDLPHGWTREEALQIGGPGLAPDFMVIEPGWEPASMSRSLGMIGAGIVLLLVMGFIFFRGRREDEEAESFDEAS
ncbi:hypothetical protein OOZ52_12165 [Aurantiacibacter sp. D1-12]|nr:hypothetical protein [Aurantiacibacter sp. D1-12]